MGKGARPVSTCENNIYRTVQMARETSIPLGISLLGLIASWAAVLTASKPIKAKNPPPAPARTPAQPWFQKSEYLCIMGKFVVGLMVLVTTSGVLAEIK